MRWISAFAVSLLFLAACSDGPTGPWVPDGPAGPLFTHVNPAVMDGNVRCTVHPQQPNLNIAFGFKPQPEPPPSGTYSDGVLTVEIDYTATDVFDWSSNIPVLAVIVKAGNEANVYDYRPDGETEDTGLTKAGTSAISHIEFCYAPALIVTKDADTELTRTWTWDIEKELDVDLPEEFGEGDLLSVDYTVTLSASSADSDWAVSGTITIVNPAVFGLTATIQSVADVVSPDIAATVDCGVTFPHALASGATLECDYSADLPNADTRTNTATVTTTGAVGGGTGTASVDFSGATVTKVDECVDVTDVLTINGVDQPDDDLGTVCAGDLDGDGEKEITYTHTFGAGADFALQCDDNTIDNVVSFVTSDTGATGSDSAGFEIFVICEVHEPQSETAWAANANTPAELRYNQRGNWATYVEYTGEKTTTLFAGQTIEVGTVHFSAVSGGQVTITIELIDGWEFEDGSVVAVQDYATAPSGNPAPGQFDHKEDASGTEHEIVVPENNFYGVHAVVVK